MRRFTLLTLALAGTALAWVPKLDEPTAKTVIDAAYDRLSTPLSTLLNLDLGVKDGKFAAGDVVKAFDGGDTCVAAWLAKPQDYAQGSRPTSITLTGQADEVFLAAQTARDEFRNLTAADALKAPLRIPEGQLRAEIQIAGLADAKQRNAYNVALRVDGKIVRPVRSVYVDNWKQAEGGRWTGTMVYYFDALKAGVKPQGKLEMLLRTEADSNCAYAVTADLAKFY